MPHKISLPFNYTPGNHWIPVRENFLLKQDLPQGLPDGDAISAAATQNVDKLY